MHDIMSVALTIRSLRLRATSTGFNYHPPVITVWHRDPYRHGDNDSCDWFGQSRPLLRREAALDTAVSELFHVMGNAPYYPGNRPNTQIDALALARSKWRKRRLRWHPRWHVWHWRVQVHPIQDARRWLFSRCAKCGKGFKWAYAPSTDKWESKTSWMWWSGERDAYHHACHTESVQENRERKAILLKRLYSPPTRGDQDSKADPAGLSTTVLDGSERVLGSERRND